MKLEEIVKTCKDNELRVVDKACIEIINSPSYQSYESSSMRDRILVDYVEHRLKTYRHFKKYPESHYLRVGL